MVHCFLTPVVLLLCPLNTSLLLSLLFGKDHNIIDHKTEKEERERSQEKALMVVVPALSVFILLNLATAAAADSPACNPTCGSLQLKYPFGTGPGCGSPIFQSYITCTFTNNQQLLLLTTHTGLYPITSISYSTQTITLTPSSMFNCTSMQPSLSNFGLDWASPFQLGPSTFILLSCQPPTSSLTLKPSGMPVCDPCYSQLCASIYTCPSVVGLGLPLFPPTNTCCVYSPGNLDAKGELDLHGLRCTFTSVVSLGDYPTDPVQWEYGVALKYSHGGLDSGIVDTKCKSCEMSDGVCGYRVDDHDQFLCVCKNGYNTSSDCLNNYTPDSKPLWGSGASDDLPVANWKIWSALMAGLMIMA
ncbi:hypothetical protein ACFX2A_000349 [Malus domestica]